MNMNQNWRAKFNLILKKKNQNLNVLKCTIIIIKLNLPIANNNKFKNDSLIKEDLCIMIIRMNTDSNKPVNESF